VLVACFTLPQFGIAVERSRLTHLWGEPVTIAREDNTLQVVSDEAADLGLRPGMTVSSARALCPTLTVLPYDRPAYEQAAELIWNVLAVESSVVEPASPEVCFVELRGPDALERATLLATAISRRVRVPLLVGLAKTKFLAHNAALRSGGRGVLAVPMAEGAAFVSSLSIDDVPQLDLPTRKRLQRLGVRTLGDVLALPPADLRRQFRDVGHLLRRLAAGEDGDRVRPAWPPRGVEERFDFEEEVCDTATVHHALREGGERIAAALGRQREFCRALALTVALADGSSQRQEESLSLPLDDARGLFTAALRLLGRMRIEQPLLGLTLKASRLGSGSGVQLALLDENAHGHGLPHERRAALDATIAYLRKRYGVGCILTLAMLAQARRAGLWTYALTHTLNEPVRVATDAHGMPVRCWRPGGRGRPAGVLEFKRIQNLWKETKWFWGASATTTVFRVEADPDGLYELHRLGVEWRLGAVAD
jgi:DNA polymerase-4